MTRSSAEKPVARTIMHIDMDAFFAAVEQLDNPQYRGKPVIVGSDPKQGKGRGVVATASYEARKYGVFSAMPISQAYRRCPHGVFVRGRHQRYAEVSQQVMSILRDYTTLIEKISIDEAFLDLTGSLHLFGDAADVARDIKRRIRDEVHLTASVGIAANKFIAKIASDLQKPDGLVIVPAGQERAFLRDLPISKLWGVGKKTEENLRRFGIETIGQIAACSEIWLSQKFGKWGHALWRLSQGMDQRAVQPESIRKSISQERTFDEDVDDENRIEETLFYLSEEVARLMRQKHFKGRTVSLKLRLEDFTTFSRSRTLSTFVDSPQILRAVALDLYHALDRQGKKVRLLGIGVSQLSTLAGEQLSLFSQDAPLNARVTRLLDELEEKFGERVVKRASLLSSKKSGSSTKI